jgi:hypothetical protein
MNAAESGSPKKVDEVVVFKIRKDSKCAECGEELWPGDFLRVEKKKALCMECADLDHLVFLPRGDTALTRRATKHTGLKVVVVRWSKTRKRYERQGVLVQEAALEKAEQECMDDAEARKRQRERAAEARAEQDQAYVKEFEGAIREQFPKCPVDAAKRIASHACAKYSGRVGRSAAAKELDPQMVKLAVIAHIRHVHTKYDRLLGMMDRHEARGEVRGDVRGDVERVLGRWGGGTNLREAKTEHVIQCGRKLEVRSDTLGKPSG